MASLIDQPIETFSDDELFNLLDDIELDDDITKNKNEEAKLFCKTCNTSDHISEDTAQGIIVCINCGCVLAEVFDTSLETRQFDGESSTLARCGTITSHFLPQSSLGTTMGGLQRNKVRLLHSWSSMPYKERSLHSILKLIQSKCSQAGIVKCIEDDAKILYKNISQSKHLFGKNFGKTVIIRGTNRKALVASCVFYACKKKGNTRNPKEIAELFDLTYKDITKGYKMFLKFVLKQVQDENKISTPEDFITRYCRELHLKNEYIVQAIQIAKNIQKIDLASCSTPFTQATSSIILMIELNNLNIDRKYIAAKFNISDVTIVKTYKKLEKFKGILMNDDVCDKIAKKIEEERQKSIVPEKLKSIYQSNNPVNKDNKDNKVNNKKEIIIETLLNDDSDDTMYQPPIQLKRFNPIDNLEEYFSEINADLYDKLSQTDEEYESFFINI